MSTNAQPDFGARLMEARCRQGLRLDDAAYMARQVLPATLAISRETIRRYETGLVPEANANPVYVAALAVVYQVTISDLSLLAAAGIDTIFRHLLSELQPILKAVSGASALTNWYMTYPEPPVTKPAA